MLRSNRITSSPVNLHPRMHLRRLANSARQINSSSTETCQYFAHVNAQNVIQTIGKDLDDWLKKWNDARDTKEHDANW